MNLRRSPRRRQILRALSWLASIFLVLLAGPVSVLAFGELTEWRTATRASSGQSPDPDNLREPIVQVFGARTLGWRGAFGVHTWIATKRADESQYTVSHVIGWRYYRGGSAVVVEPGTPDFQWFGARPTLLAEHRGPGVEAMIDDIDRAVARYPYPDLYRAWPGPNSNTFTAWVAREVPALALDLPPNALGKDYLGTRNLLARAPSGTGWQVSILGLAGITMAANEGIELNLLSLSGGLDIDDARLRLPGIGFVSLAR